MSGQPPEPNAPHPDPSLPPWYPQRSETAPGPATPGQGTPPPGPPPPGAPAQPAWPAPLAPPPRAGGSYLLGMLIGLVAWPAPFLLAGVIGNELGKINQDAGTIGGGLTALVGLAGVVTLAVWLIANPARRRTGAGILIALGVLPILAAGVCLALFAMAFNSYG